MSNVLPIADDALNAWVQNFNTVAAANATALKLSAADLAALQDAMDDFSNALSTALATKATLKSQIQTKDVAKQSLGTVVRAFNKRFRTIPTSPTLIALLGLPVYDDERTPAVPYTPLSFTATPATNGTVTFKYQRNGNSQRARFFVERSTALLGPWTPVATTSRTRFTVGGFPPGEATYFRVIAQVNGQASTPSNTAVIYGSIEETEMLNAA